MNAYEMDDHPTLYAADTPEEATRLYVADTGVTPDPDDGYPRELTARELDREIPELDENEAITDRTTSVRKFLAEAAGPGFLASAP